MNVEQDVGTQHPLHMAQSIFLDLMDKFESALKNTSFFGYVLSLLVGLVSVIWSNFFGFLTILLACTMLADWLLGRWNAYRTAEYESGIAHRGIVTKATGYGVILVVWLFESRALQEFGWFESSKGLVGTVLLMLFLIDELDSVEKNRIKLGAQPIPLWTPALQHLRGAATRIVPQPPGSMPIPGAPTGQPESPDKEE